MQCTKYFPLFVKNPFSGGIYRDSDIEGMSDGWDHMTTYGHNAGDASFRMHARNSGMFFAQVCALRDTCVGISSLNCVVVTQ